MFRAGDKVICIDDKDKVFLANGCIYTIRENQIGNIVNIKGIIDGFFARRFELYEKTVAYPTLRKNYERV